MTDKERAYDTSGYRALIGKRIMLVLVLIVITLIVFGISMTIGGRSIGFFEAYEYLFGHIMGATYPPDSVEWLDDHVLWFVRLPRGVFALIAGATLGVCGCVMQSVLKNPLADAYTTGVASGACLGVAVATVLGLSATGASQVYDIGTFFNALIFALIPVALIVSLLPYLNRSTASLILVGIAITYILDSFNTLLLVITDSDTLAHIYVWQVGTVSNVYWNDIALVSVICITSMIILGYLSNRMNLLSLGDASAKSLGLNVDNFRVLTMVICSVAVAIVVCNAGILGFLGLISPHLVRLIIGEDNKFVLPASAILGSAILLGSDIVARVLSPQGEIPVGVVVSFIGAPILLYLIVRRHSNVY